MVWYGNGGLSNEPPEPLERSTTAGEWLMFAVLGLVLLFGAGLAVWLVYQYGLTKGMLSTWTTA